MKVYVRKIDNQCVEKQISVLKSIVNDFFGNNLIIEENDSVPGGKVIKFVAVDLETRKEGYVRILPQTDPRFSSSDIKSILSKNYDVGDILVFYETNRKYELELIKPIDLKYKAIAELCERDERHTLLEIDSSPLNVEKNKERFKKWLIAKNYSDSSSVQYANHVNLASKEAMEKEVIHVNLYDVSDINELTILVDAIKQMEEYIIRKNNGNGINEAALNLYLSFAKETFEFSVEENNDFEEYNKDKFLEDVFINEDKYNSIVSILSKKKNIILEGAPGVGKTFMAKRLAYSIIGKKDQNKVKLIQFHQSYSYEDFVEGYRPADNGFKLEQGIFYKLCKKAEANPTENYYLIIDEINRGNLSKIFGELLMLIESDKRGEQLTLAYSEENFSVPENLYIIGLMNTADRSLALIDYALRRRFSFIRIEPAFESEKFIKAFNEKFDNNFNNVIEIIKKINEAIEQDKSLGAGFKIGHSYFCPNLKDRKGNKKDIEDIIIYEILPLLEEYWYDDPDSIIQWKDALSGVLND